MTSDIPLRNRYRWLKGLQCFYTIKPPIACQLINAEKNCSAKAVPLILFCQQVQLYWNMSFARRLLLVMFGNKQSLLTRCCLIRKNGDGKWTTENSYPIGLTYQMVPWLPDSWSNVCAILWKAIKDVVKLIFYVHNSANTKENLNKIRFFYLYNKNNTSIFIVGVCLINILILSVLYIWLSKC